MSERPRWNSNLHALEVLLACLPSGISSGLDVGCGEGETARRLRQHIPHVTGVDVDAASIKAARGNDDDINYVCADFMTEPVSEGFDVVISVAMLHHVDHELALARMAGLLGAGGTLLVVGLAKSRSARDFLRDAWDSVLLRRHSIPKGVWNTTAPTVWPPPLTYTEARAATERALPGASFRRVPYFRFSVTYTRPD